MKSPILLVTDDPSLATSHEAPALDLVACEPVRCLSMTAQRVPSLVAIDLEVRTVAWPSVLGALLTEARTRGVPVVGLSRDAGPHVFPVIAGMHDVLPLPLDATRCEELCSLAITLGFQVGGAGREPGSAAADRLVRFAQRTRVSGTLECGPAAAPTGSATFSDGALASCRLFAGGSGHAALAAMLAAKGDLRFRRGTAAAPIVEEAPVMESLDDFLLATLEPVLAPLSFDPPSEEKTVVLAVDDDPDLLELVVARLTKEGFDVRTASDGEEGFAAALALRPGAIVSDLEMPHLDGWGLLRKIRADFRLADTPLLFLSAAEDFRMSIQAGAAGAQDYLSKNGARELLSTKLRAALAPRLALELAIRSQCAARSRVELTGARWSLLRFAALAPRGTVTVSDGFGVHEVAFENGEMRSADSTIGTRTLTGAPALEAFLGVRAGELHTSHTVQRPANLSGRVVATVEAAAERCNAAEALAVTRVLASRSALAIDHDLCMLYERFGPLPGRVVAAGLRGGAAPFDLLERSSNRAEVERILQDLARRGVIVVDRPLEPS